LHHGKLACFAYSPDGSLLATGGRDGDKEGVVKLWAQPDGALQATLEAHEGEVKDVLFSRDGQSLVTASGDKTVKVWEVASRKLLRTLSHDEGCQALALTAKGEALAVASGQVHLWDMKTGQRRTVLKTAPYRA